MTTQPAASDARPLRRDVQWYLVAAGLAILGLRFAWVATAKLVGDTDRAEVALSDAAVADGSDPVVQQPAVSRRPRRRRAADAPRHVPPADAQPAAAADAASPPASADDPQSPSPPSSPAPPADSARFPLGGLEAPTVPDRAIAPPPPLAQVEEEPLEVVRHDLLTDADVASDETGVGAPVDEANPIASPTDDVAADTPAPPQGLVLVNPAENGLPIHYALEGTLHVLAAGQRQVFEGPGSRVIRFHRGGDFGEARLEVEGGTYEFRVSRAGWALLRSDGPQHGRADPR